MASLHIASERALCQHPVIIPSLDLSNSFHSVIVIIESVLCNLADCWKALACEVHTLNLEEQPAGDNTAYGSGSK